MHNPSEADTRKSLIDPALERAGWRLGDPNQVREEIPVDDVDAGAWHALQARLKQLHESGIPYEAEGVSGITDYALYRENGEVLAVVEAKKTSIDPRLALPQAEFYATEIEKHQSFRPFAFMANGFETYFWDVGAAPKRLVHGFFSRADLNHLLYIRQNKTPLTQASINTSITDRPYGMEAIRKGPRARRGVAPGRDSGTSRPSWRSS